MNHFLWLWIAFAVTAVCCAGCGRDPQKGAPAGDGPTQAAKADNRVAESWIAKPTTEWPQIVLTNEAEFKGHSSLQVASSFLIRTDDGRVLAMAANLLGEAGGVEPPVPIDQLTSRIQSWKMHPRTVPDALIEVTSPGVKGLARENLDWLVLSIKEKEQLPAYPLRLRKDPVSVGETVFLIGCPYREQGPFSSRPITATHFWPSRDPNCAATFSRDGNIVPAKRRTSGLVKMFHR